MKASWSAASCGVSVLTSGRCTYGLSRLLGRDVARMHGTVDAAAFIQLDAARPDVAFDDARGLKLESALGDNRPRHPSADNGVLRDDIPFDRAVLSYDDGLAGA